MRSGRVIHIVSAHAEGEVGDVIVGGVAPPPGATLWEQRRFIAEDGALRDLVLNEPRGGVFRHVNLLVPPKHHDAAMGFIIMEPADTPPMSGSNSICVATVLLETGIVPMVEPITEFAIEAPAGLIPIRAHCADGKATRIEVQNVNSFAAAQNVRLPVPGLGILTVDTAYGGDSFIVVDAPSLGFSIVPSEARQLAETGRAIVNAANNELTFHHPDRPDWQHFSFCLFAGPIMQTADGLSTTHAVAIKPGKIDRSPTGTAVSARMALLHAKGLMANGDRLTARSIIGSEFHGKIVGETAVADHPAIVPLIAGQAWITGTHQLTLDPTDPWPRGYRLSDTWPDLG